MTNPSTKKQLQTLQSQLKKLQDELALVNQAAGIDEHITVTAQKSQAHAKRIKIESGPDKGLADFYITVDITAKKETVYVPISIASGAKPTGFMYQIEGTAAATIKTTDINCRSKDVSQVSLGTLLYAKIGAGKTASFEIAASIRGKANQEYKIVITRINYKLNLTDARYQHYIKEWPTVSVKIT